MATSEPPPFSFTLRPRRATGLVIAQVLQLVGGVLAGYGTGCTVIDGNDAGPPSYVAGDDVGVATVGGAVVAIIGFVVWALLVDRFPLQVGQLHSWGTLGLSGALGLLLAAEHLGVAGRYALVALGLAVFGVAFFLLASAAAARRRRRWQHEVDLIARGTPVPATVVDSGLQPEDFEEASNVITTASFSFVGADGRTHRLHRQVVVPSSAVLLEGQRTTVWYDPDDPLDDRAMVVGIQHALRWNVPVPRPAAEPPAVPS